MWVLMAVLRKRQGIGDGGCAGSIKAEAGEEAEKKGSCVGLRAMILPV